MGCGSSKTLISPTIANFPVSKPKYESPQNSTIAIKSNNLASGKTPVSFSTQAISATTITTEFPGAIVYSHDHPDSLEREGDRSILSNESAQKQQQQALNSVFFAENDKRPAGSAPVVKQVMFSSISEIPPANNAKKEYLPLKSNSDDPPLSSSEIPSPQSNSFEVSKSSELKDTPQTFINATIIGSQEELTVPDTNKNESTLLDASEPPPRILNAFGGDAALDSGGGATGFLKGLLNKKKDVIVVKAAQDGPSSTKYIERLDSVESLEVLDTIIVEKTHFVPVGMSGDVSGAPPSKLKDSTIPTGGNSEHPFGFFD